MLILHLLVFSGQPITFHNAVFASFSNLSPRQIEETIESTALRMLEQLRALKPRTMEDALGIIDTWHLPLSQNDADVALR